MPTRSFHSRLWSKNMVCTNPNYLWLKNHHPINFQEWHEQNQANWNKGSFHREKDRYCVQVPCNKCLGCRLDHANMWSNRMYIEAKQWKHNMFVTLTYDNEHLPTDRKLHKKDIQDFLKRLRYYYKGIQEWENPKNGKQERPIRYFCCGEYGDKRGRPHYHMALFNLTMPDLKFYKLGKNGDKLYYSAELKKIWGKGFVIIGELTQRSACYIARYVQKKAGVHTSSKVYKHYFDTEEQKYKKKLINKIGAKPCEEEFILMSTGVGLGRQWWEENKEFAKKWQYIPVEKDGKITFQPLPRYFKKLWEKEDWESYEIAKYENGIKARQKMEEILKLEKWNVPEYTDKWLLHLKKIEKALSSKIKHAPRNNFV